MSSFSAPIAEQIWDMKYESVPQPGLDGRVYYPRGKGLGGSSNLNGLGNKIAVQVNRSAYLPTMIEINRKDAERQHYKPDSTVCAGDVPAGRPYPSDVPATRQDSGRHHGSILRPDRRHRPGR